MHTISGNIGLPLGETGFLNLTGEYGNAFPTDRSVQRNDALALINRQRNTAVRQPAQIWGSPEVTDEIKLWANAGYNFDDFTQLYAHGNYVTKQVEGGFYFRNPNTPVAESSGPAWTVRWWNAGLRSRRPRVDHSDPDPASRRLARRAGRRS